VSAGLTDQLELHVETGGGQHWPTLGSAAVPEHDMIVALFTADCVSLMKKKKHLVSRHPSLCRCSSLVIHS